MDLQKVWEAAVRFHGCQCPGLAIGARATAHVIEYFGLDPSDSHQMVCTAECFSCSIDAIQAVLGCTIGNGRLRVTNNHKLAFRFCDGGTNHSVYLTLRSFQQARPGLTELIMQMPITDLFTVEILDEVPTKAPNSVLSSACLVRNPDATKGQKAAQQTAVARGYDRDW